jgi:hypothetical protein
VRPSKSPDPHAARVMDMSSEHSDRTHRRRSDRGGARRGQTRCALEALLSSARPAFGNDPLRRRLTRQPTVPGRSPEWPL